MRPAMNVTAIALVVALTACGNSAGDADGPERRTAAGEVLGGDASDAMLPVDSVRSTAPLAPRVSSTGDNARGARSDGDAEETSGEPAPTLPQPEMSGGPEPLPGGTDAPVDPA